jgi:hypothetical protein
LGDRLYKFAGYGRYGRQTLARAERLRGWAPEPLELADGFLATRWVEGRQPALTEEFIEHAARYLAFVRREFASSEPAQSLEELVEVNTGLTVKSCQGQPVHLDARVAPHEWLETASGWIKTDALDHHDDHFFPGPQDTAWDLAAFSAEFGGGEYLLERYIDESGDRDAAGRLPFFRLAYLAFRLGYCELAAQSLNGSEDAMRFRSEGRRYRELIWRTTTDGQLCA